MNVLIVNVFFVFFMIFFSKNSFSDFRVYDATLFKNKPDLSIYKIQPLPIIYENSFFGNNKDNNVIPSSENIKKVARKISESDSKVAVLDIERWKLIGDANLVNSSLPKYIKVIDSIREYKIDTLLGYYGVAPNRNYWDAISDTSSMKYLSWQSGNNLIKSLVNKVDVLFPSLYTFYSDQKGWKKYAVAQILEARRLAGSKQVIVFLWPQYHGSNKILGGKYLPVGYWRLQLETARLYADGVVIWGGWQQDWDANAPWWKETLSFINDGKGM